MRVLKDRFNRQVHLGDKIVYGANRGLVIGVVVKWNPNTFKIRSIQPGDNQTVNIPYGYSYSLALIDSINVLSDCNLTNEDKLRIETDRVLRDA